MQTWFTGSGLWSDGRLIAGDFFVILVSWVRAKKLVGLSLFNLLVQPITQYDTTLGCISACSHFHIFCQPWRPVSHVTNLWHQFTAKIPKVPKWSSKKMRNPGADSGRAHPPPHSQIPTSLQRERERGGWIAGEEVGGCNTLHRWS